MLFTEALAEAELVLAKQEVSVAEVNSAYEKLIEAYSNLTRRADFSSLETAVAQANALDLDDFINAGKEEFVSALANAKKVLNNDEATAAEIDQATTLLTSAQSALIEKADVTDLRMTLSGAIYAPSHYTASSYNAYVIAKEIAEIVLGDSQATQAEVDQANTALKKAINDLKEIGNKTVLKNAVLAAEKVQKGTYSQESWAQFQTVLAYAKTVVNSNDVVQTEVDEAYRLLTQAQAVLTEESSGCGSVTATPFAMLAMLAVGMLLKKKKQS
jgi:hypothetical protein